MDLFKQQLAMLAQRARVLDHGAEWQRACGMLESGADIIPPADMVAPSMLPEVGDRVMSKAAEACASFILHSLRIREAETALSRLKPYQPSRQMVADGWTEAEAFATLGTADEARVRFMRQRAKARKES